MKLQWVSTKECVQRCLDLESEYPQAANLFQFLLSSGKGEIGALINAASLITRSTKLSQIAEHFARISRQLQKMNLKKSKEAVKLLVKRPLFPIIQKGGDAEFDALVGLGTSTDWLVADSQAIRDSFLGKFDLLAFDVPDLEMMETLLKALQLDSRKLSKLVKTETSPKGTITLHPEYTKRLQAKSPFIIAYVRIQFVSTNDLANMS